MTRYLGDNTKRRKGTIKKFLASETPIDPIPGLNATTVEGALIELAAVPPPPPPILWLEMNEGVGDPQDSAVPPHPTSASDYLWQVLGSGKNVWVQRNVFGTLFGRINVGSDADLIFANGNFTFAAWIDFQGNQPGFMFGRGHFIAGEPFPPPPPVGGWEIKVAGNKPQFKTLNPGATTTTTGTVPSNGWVFIAGVVEPYPGTCKLYINGLDDTAAPVVHTSPFTTGNFHLGWTFQGPVKDVSVAKWGEVAIYNSELNPAQILALFNDSKALYGI